MQISRKSLTHLKNHYGVILPDRFTSDDCIVEVKYAPCRWYISKGLLFPYEENLLSDDLFKLE